MTREEHLNLWREHSAKRDAAMKAWSELLNTHDILNAEVQKYWNEYKAESKLANKHWGIAAAIFTRKHGRI